MGADNRRTTSRSGGDPPRSTQAQRLSHPDPDGPGGGRARPGRRRGRPDRAPGHGGCRAPGGGWQRPAHPGPATGRRPVQAGPPVPAVFGASHGGRGASPRHGDRGMQTLRNGHNGGRNPAGSGGCELDHVGAVSPATARRLACDASVLPVVLGGPSEPLDVARRTPVVSAALRRAVVLRDQRCRFPTCTWPHSWCDAHHATHWADGGETALANLVLLCRPHHRCARGRVRPEVGRRQTRFPTTRGLGDRGRAGTAFTRGDPRASQRQRLKAPPPEDAGPPPRRPPSQPAPVAPWRDP